MDNVFSRCLLFSDKLCCICNKSLSSCLSPIMQGQIHSCIQIKLLRYKQSPHSKFITSGMVEIGIFLNHTNTSNDELSNIPICWISNLTVTHVRLMNSIRLYQLCILTSITEIIPKLCYTKNITIKKKLTLVKTSISKLMPMFLIKHSYK